MSKKGRLDEIEENEDVSMSTNGGFDGTEEEKVGEEEKERENTAERIAELEQRLAAQEAEFSAERERLAGLAPAVISDIVAYIRRKNTEFAKKVPELNPKVINGLPEKSVLLIKYELWRLDAYLESVVEELLATCWWPHKDLNWECFPDNAPRTLFGDVKGRISVIRGIVLLLELAPNILLERGLLDVKDVVVGTTQYTLKWEGPLAERTPVMRHVGRVPDLTSVALHGYNTQAASLYRIARAISETRGELERFRARQRWDEFGRRTEDKQSSLPVRSRNGQRHKE